MELEHANLLPLDGAPGVAMSMLTSGAAPELTRVDVAVIDAGASIPKHVAGRQQVLYVVSGEGCVAAMDDVEHRVQAGSVVRWSVGEDHTTWADTRMTVLIIQIAAPH